MQLPDLYYDKENFTNNSSIKNGIHLGLDISQFVPFANNPITNAILALPGIIDDGYTAITDRDILETIENYNNNK